MRSACTRLKTASTPRLPRHALYLLGLDHMQLIYRHKNRPERPTLNEGVACEKIVNG